MFYVNPYLRFWFRHGTGGERYKATTTCIIEELDPETTGIQNWRLRGVGSAHCGKDDNFSRKIGRQISLSRALEGMYFYKQKRLRKKVWETYFANVSDLK